MIRIRWRPWAGPLGRGVAMTTRTSRGARMAIHRRRCLKRQAGRSPDDVALATGVIGHWRRRMRTNT
jgi:hypothetical protein